AAPPTLPRYAAAPPLHPPTIQPMQPPPAVDEVPLAPGQLPPASLGHIHPHQPQLAGPGAVARATEAHVLSTAPAAGAFALSVLSPVVSEHPLDRLRRLFRCKDRSRLPRLQALLPCDLCRASHAAFAFLSAQRFFWSWLRWRFCASDMGLRLRRAILRTIEAFTLRSIVSV